MSDLGLPANECSEPKLNVPSEARAAWFHGMSRGPLLMVSAFLVGICMTAVILLGALPAKLAELAGIPLLSMLYLVAGWMLTAPQPGNPYWQVLPRWLARAGLIVGVLQHIMRAAAVYLLQANVDSLAPLYAQADLVTIVGTTAMAWYVCRLAYSMLSDWLLTGIHAFYALLIGGSAIGSIMAWPEAVQSAAKRLSANQNWGASYRVWSSSLAGIAVPIAFVSLAFFVELRLWRRLRAAAQDMKTA